MVMTSDNVSDFFINEHEISPFLTIIIGCWYILNKNVLAEAHRKFEKVLVRNALIRPKGPI